MTDDVPQLSELDARLQLEVAVQQLLTPVVEQLDRSRAEVDPDVAATADADARDHAARMIKLRARHRAAHAADDKAAMRRVMAAMLTTGAEYRRRQQDRTRDTAITPSLLTRLQAAITSTHGHGNRSAGVHRSPIGLDAAELVADIERTVARHAPAEALPVRVRHWAAVAEQAATPDLVDAALTAVRWVDRARQILDPGRTAEVQGACPVCGERYVWVLADDGTRIRKAALQLTYATRSAHCLNPRCDGRWTAEYLHHLADVVEQDVTERKAIG